MRKVNTIKIGKNIQAIRKSNGYTQERLAEKIEVSVRYVSDIEQDRANPSYEVLIRICNLFKVSFACIKVQKSFTFIPAIFIWATARTVKHNIIIIKVIITATSTKK